MCFWVTFVQESREIENNTGEEQGQTKQEDGDQEEDDGEHLFGDNMENDYRPMPQLDR